MTEAVSLGESTPRTLIPVWTLLLRHISSSLSVARPFTNGVEWGWKKCTDPMVGGARSITLYDACTPSSGCHWFNRQKKDFEHARGPYVIPPTQLI